MEDSTDIRIKLSRIRESDGAFPARSAVASFLFMVMPIDGQTHPKEIDRLSRILSDDFDLDARETEELIQHAQEQGSDSETMVAMADILLAEMTKADLLVLISHMWEMVFADGRMHETEILLVERVAGLLKIPQEEVSNAMNS